MSASSRPPKRKAAEAAESKMARIEVQNDPIDEVLRSSDLVDDGIDLHAQVHPRLVHEQVAGWHEQMLAPVVVHRILRVDVERMINHTAACRAPLEAPSAARAWCDDQRADSKDENYLDVPIDVDDFEGAKGRSGPNSVRPSRAPLEAPNAARTWCDERADSKAEDYIDIHNFRRFGGAKGGTFDKAT